MLFMDFKVYIQFVTRFNVSDLATVYLVDN